MSVNENHWFGIIGLVSELKRCDKAGLVSASIAMAFICIDSISSLARPVKKDRVTRSDFITWVNRHLKGHEDQPYQYRGKDVYAARCAFLHTYGSEATLHSEDSSIIKFVYHDGGKHSFNESIDPNLVVIGVKSFVNDVVWAVDSFLNECSKDPILKARVEPRLKSVLQVSPINENVT